MKYSIKILLLLLFLLPSCSEVNKNNTGKGTEVRAAELVYDTIVINFDSIQHLKNQKEEIWGALDVAQLIDSLKTLNSNNERVKFTDSDILFGGYKKMAKYYSNNIPKTLYTKLFPSEEIRISKERKSGSIIKELERKVYLNKGTLVSEERKYKYLYFFKEMENCLLMVFTKQGKFSPELELITSSKKDFRIIKQLDIYGGIYDSYDINYWFSQFEEDHKSIRVTKIENKEFTSVRLDTVEVIYKIKSDGDIVEIGRD